MRKLALVFVTLLLGCEPVSGNDEPKRPTPERSPEDMTAPTSGERSAVFQSLYRNGTFFPEIIPHGLGTTPRLYWISIYSAGDDNLSPTGELAADDTNLYLGATNSTVKYRLHAIK